MNDLKKKLENFNQEHLLKFYDELNENEKKILLEDIEKIDFQKIQEIYQEISVEKNLLNKENDSLEPLNQNVFQSIYNLDEEKKNYYRQLGFQKIREGKVAVILLAGGQGTRLGVNYPKGMYDVGLPSKKTLFQIQAERLLKLQKLSSNEVNVCIPWFIMTSGSTQTSTINYFKENNYFGLKEDQIYFFKQGTLPCFTMDGKIILSSKNEISRSPDGNGGLYDSLKNNLIVEKLKELKVDYVHAYCVDNILVKIADPTFLGYCIDKNADAGVKSVEKDYPHEPVGIFCKKNDKYQVVEYTEISKELAEKKNENGKLVYGCGNICNHFFTVNFLNKVIHEKLPHHVAKKKIPFINDEGNLIKPEKPNGIKLEKFIFDVLPYSENFVVLEVIRDEEFSPLKNHDSESKDTPTTARTSIFKLHKKYIEKSGGVIKDNETNFICEISPLISYEGENIESIVKGKTFISPVILKSEIEKAY